jgi:hypothetical protein
MRMLDAVATMGVPSVLVVITVGWLNFSIIA